MSVGESRRTLSRAAPDALALALAGDERALDALLRPLLQPAYRIAYLMLRDREAAEDAVQNAALKSWRKLARLRPDSDPLPWFIAFVANECRNMRRSRWRSVIRLGERDDVVAETQEWGSDPDLQRALGRLAERDRLLVLLHFYLDMRLEEMAIVTGSRIAAVRSRLYRAVKELKRHMDVKDISDG